MQRRFCDDVDLIERKQVRIFTLLRDHDWVKAAEAGYLPVDVQHLRLEKGRAIKGGDRARTKLAKAIKIPNVTSLFITISPVKGLAGYTPPAHNCQGKWIIWKKRGASLTSKLSSCSGCASGWATISRARSD